MTWCDDGTVLYHGTQDPDGVVENGLDPGHRSAHLATGGHEHTDQLYLSPKQSVAERFGESVKVCVRGVDHLAPDPEFTTNESLTYSDEIPPEDVRHTEDFTTHVDFSNAEYTDGHVVVPVGDEEFTVDTSTKVIPKVTAHIESSVRFKGDSAFHHEEVTDMDRLKSTDPEVFIPELLDDFHTHSGTEQFCDDVAQAFRANQAKELNLECTGKIPHDELQQLDND